MRILILGGDGFCGWPTSLFLSEKGHDVHIVDNLSRRNIDNELGVNSLTPVSSIDVRLNAWKEATGKNIEFTNLDVNKYRQIRKPLSFKAMDVNTMEDSREKQLAGYVGIFFAIVIFLFILLYGVQVMRGVLEEKSNRIIEVLVSSVKPISTVISSFLLNFMALSIKCLNNCSNLYLSPFTIGNVLGIIKETFLGFCKLL